MSNLERYFAPFGRVCRDRVTGFEGVAESIGFDLYGCVQALVRPRGMDEKEGGTRRAEWFDVKRLEVLGEPLMELPDFGIAAPQAVREIGPADKPDMRR